MKILKHWIGRLLGALLVLILIGLLLPEDIQMPVSGASNGDFNHNSFWFYPWGKSITHKGVDIFAKKHTPVYAASEGLVVSVGQNEFGGNFALVLGPKWRFHYYAIWMRSKRVDIAGSITTQSLAQWVTLAMRRASPLTCIIPSALSFHSLKTWVLSISNSKNYFS